MTRNYHNFACIEDLGIQFFAEVTVLRTYAYSIKKNSNLFLQLNKVHGMG